MMNTEKLKQVIEAYKADFSEHFEGERYKWEAVKCFQDNWNIEADDFAAMIKKSLSKTGNLLASGYFYPYRMLLHFAKDDSISTRKALATLFEENKELTERIKQFQDFAEDRKQNHNYTGWKNHYQDIRTISVYLTLRYPEKYYFYKSNVYKTAIELTGFIQPKGFSAIDKFLKYYEICDELYEVIKTDTELIEMISTAFPEVDYKVFSLHMLVQDILYFYTSKTQPIQKSKKLFPLLEEYTPKLTVDDWKKLINDESIFDKNSVSLIKSIYDNGGHSTCSELAEKYGDTPMHYSGIATGLAKRIAKATGCPTDKSKQGEERFWTILFTAKQAAKEQPGVWVWQLRDELKRAYELSNLNTSVYTKEDFLSQVYITSNQYDTLTALLEHKKNVILQGAPGVGKTFTAKRLAYSIMGEKDDSRIEFVQFHQSYSYEDFIMGYRPTDKDSFELKRGVFYRFCDKARNDPDRKYFFIIDEINRGNLSKIFGEMLMLIEADKRGDKLKLTYQKEDDEPFSVPDNLYIIGMMNTADRSLAMIDYALRRRFSFFEMSPGFDSEGFKGYSDSLNNDYFNALIAQIKLLNKDIEKDSSLGKGFCIGHSYFCNLTSNICTDERLREIVEYDIIPMLSEYWFDDRDKADKWSANLRGLFNDD